VLPSVLLARQLYWACPFIPHIWTSERLRVRVGVVGSWLLRFCFEGAHCMSVLSRLLTLPMRPHLPHFYILGFPVSAGGSLLGTCCPVTPSSIQLGLCCEPFEHENRRKHWYNLAELANSHIRKDC
jgi:hypothetical protein